MLEYRALGGLTVVDGGDELSLGGSRQRRLAAVLLIDRNRVVSVDRLAEIVFAGEPTPAAATTLRSYVARLRRVVERAGSVSRVVTRPPGYMLEVGDDAFDVARFESSLATGRDCLARGDPAGATRVLRDGLGLWRGPAYAEFADEDWARPEAQRLGELRLVAYELLADAELACGRAAEIASELEALAAEHPLREAFQAKLMLALYRSGRQVEALRAYQAHRDVLAGELGLEPPPELAELEGRILVHDEALRELEPGELRLRGYRLGERLGTGRDGTVYAARLPRVERDLVIRVVPDAVANDPRFVRSFDADARRVAALRHPAVVPLYDWWREPSAAFIVMRRMRGGTLRDRVQRGPQSSAEVTELAARVGAALVAAADVGIAHGRVVAESILFDEAGAAYLADFPLGTDEVRAPGDDVRDLAAVVAEALTGQRPIATAVGDVPAAARDVLTGALSGPEAPPLGSFVPAVVAALTGGAAEPVYERPNPYKGLRAFDEPDAEDFFGRDALVDEILARLAEGGLRGRLVLVAGGSGSGKSSLVRAGLLPRVRRGAAGGSERWFVAAMVPGASPFKELAESLRRVAVVETNGLADELAFDEQGIDRVVRRIVPEGGELLLVVDQLEELFTLAGDAEQRAFLDGLIHALSVADSRLRVVATLRADFYDRPLRFERFGAAVGDATVPIAAMSAAELEAAIAGPAERVGGRVEPTLAAELVGAVLREPAALPSLQYTLYELAERSSDRTLSLAAYRELGGVDGAIAARAEELYQSLDDQAREGVRRLFRRLVVVGAEGEPTRRRALRSELAADTGNAVGGVLDVIEVWAGARLLTLDRHPESREPTVEVAHEALLREWPRLRGWLEDDREEIVALARLREAAASWADLDRDPGALYRGARLDTALALADGRSGALPTLERVFVEASRAERDRESQREVEQHQRTVRANRRLRAQLVALAVALVVALVVGLVAVRQRDRAQESKAQADASAMVAEARRIGTEALTVQDLDASLLLATEGRRLHDSNDTRANLLAALNRSPEAIGVVRIEKRPQLLVVTGDGRHIAMRDNDGGLFFYDAATLERVADLPDGSASALTPTADGRGVAGVTDGPDQAVVRFFDPATGKETRHPLQGLPPLIASPLAAAANIEMDISDDGRYLATATSADRRGLAYETIWDLDQPTKPPRRLGYGVDRPSVAFTPGGQLVIASFGAVPGVGVSVVDPASGAVLLPDPEAHVPIAVSPDGKTLAATTGESKSTLVFIDLATGAHRRSLAGHSNPIASLAFSPDGRSLASASDDRTVIVWDAATGERTAVLEGHSGGVHGLGYGADGHTLYSASLDGTMIAWDLAGDRRFLRQIASPDSPRCLAVRGCSTWVVPSPDGTKLSYSYTGGRFAVRHLPRLGFGPEWSSGHPVVGRLAWAPDGRHLVTVGEDGMARLWDPTTGRKLAEHSLPRHSVAEATGSRPGGDTIFVGLVDGGVVELDAQTLEPVGEPLRVEGQVANVDVSPDDQLLAVALAYPSALLLVDAQTGGVLETLDGIDGAYQLAFSPDGSTLAAGGADGKLTLVDPATRRLVSAPLRAVDGRVTSLEFSPDGTRIVTAGTDGTVSLWDVAASERIGRITVGTPNRAVFAWFGDDGRRVMTAGQRGGIWSFPSEPDEWQRHACQIAGRNLTRGEWDEFIPDRPYHRTCPQYPATT